MEREVQAEKADIWHNGDNAEKPACYESPCVKTEAMTKTTSIGNTP